MPTLELIAYVGCVVAAAGLLLRLGWGSGWRLTGLCIVVLQAGVTLPLLVSQPEADDVPTGAPLEQIDSEYASSRACRSCHPGEYASWHQSYHRSMTQLPSPRSVRAPWQQVLTLDGRSYELFRRGDQFWARLPDPDLVALRQRTSMRPADIPSVERRIVMTTGSHHYQAYWVSGERGNELWQFPFVYHFETQRFIPRRDAFLQPPDAPGHQARWNSNCIQCHSVAGRPQHDPKTDRFQTRVVELGIACEACHGPAADHVRAHRNPVSRHLARWSDSADSSIVNPERLAATAASQVCGQCHAYFVPARAEQWWHSGFAEAFRPGQSLADSRLVLDYERDRARPDPLISASMDSVFFEDGTIRVGGREYNGLIRSPCFQEGRGERKLGCLSCHLMHGQDPVDQLKPAATTHAACLGCHQELGARVEDHTHHPADSSGSNCYNCHMPFTSYALFKGIRSHRITSPDATASSQLDTLNACNLCHLDKSLGWTARHLERWYEKPQPPLTTEAETLSHSARGLLAGDAATRALIAYSMGWEAALQASGSGWQAPLLAELLDDPYSAVRFVAHRSLARQPGFGEFRYDFLAAPSARRERRERASELARSLLAKSPPSVQRRALDQVSIERLIAERDHSPISISE